MIDLQGIRPEPTGELTALLQTRLNLERERAEKARGRKGEERGAKKGREEGNGQRPGPPNAILGHTTAGL